MIRRSDYTAAALGAFKEPTPMSRAQTDHTTTTGGSCALSCAICLYVPYAALYGIAEGQPTNDGDPALVAYGGDDRDAGGANADASGVNRRRDGLHAEKRRKGYVPDYLIPCDSIAIAS